ncbi:MAG: SpoIIE family protein phosphatase [Bacteroidales bacterium]|nr:SpoIIE family protein phosphatase [Bacteroidales bacterium]
MSKFSLFAIFLVTLFLFSCNALTDNKNKVEKGKIDLSDWDFDTQGSIDLRGEWEFYWQKFYTSEDFKEKNIQPENYIIVPSLWNKQKVDSQIIGSDGYGTLRLKIKIKEGNRILALRINRIETSYKLFINGELVKQIGTPGIDKQSTNPYWNPTNVEFICDTTDLEIILQIANYHHKKIGTSGTILLGNIDTITKKSNKINYFNIFLIGVLLIISLYHFGLFILRREDSPSLFFAIFCISTAFVSFFFGDVMMGKIFPWISWKISVNVLFLSYYSGIFSFTLFINSIFKKHFNQKIIYGLMSVQIIFALITIFTPVKVFSYLMMPFQISALFTLLFLMFGLIIAAIKKDEGAIFSALALVILIATAINDILLDQILIKSTYLLSLGTFTFVFLQSFTISLRFSRLFTTNKELTVELEDINKTLENKVKERTVKIEQQKEELVVQADNLIEINEELNQQKEELMAQSESLEKANKDISKKSDLIQKQNEDITNSIIYARRIQTALLPADKLFENNFSDFFILYMPRDIVSGDFYWMKKINNHILIAVADCTGHGVPGAFVSMLGISLLNEIVRKNEIESTSEVLESFRSQLKTSLNQINLDSESRDGMDISFCAINTETKELEFSGANNPIYIIRKNIPENNIDVDERKNMEFNDSKLYTISASRQPIGIYFNEHQFTSKKVHLNKDDQVVLLTDGFYDQFNEDKKSKYYSRNFKKILIRNYGKKLEHQKDNLLSEFTRWKGKGRQIDDVLVISFKL